MSLVTNFELKVFFFVFQVVTGNGVLHPVVSSLNRIRCVRILLIIKRVIMEISVLKPMEQTN